MAKRKNSILKQFFSSLWEDFVNLFKKHFLRMIGYLISFVLPMVVLIVGYIEKKPESWGLPILIILPLVLLVLVYWGKARRFIASKVQAMKVENNIQKGKHAGALMICEVLSIINTVLPFVIIVLIIKGIEQIQINLVNIMYFIIGCILVGGFFIFIDTCKNVAYE